MWLCATYKHWRLHNYENNPTYIPWRVRLELRHYSSKSILPGLIHPGWLPVSAVGLARVRWPNAEAADGPNANQTASQRHANAGTQDDEAATQETIADAVRR